MIGMIRSFEELTEEQLEVLSEVVIDRFPMRRGQTYYKGTELFKKLVSVEIGKKTVAELFVGVYERTQGRYVIYVKSPRIKFLEMIVTQEQYDQLLGVI